MEVENLMGDVMCSMKVFIDFQNEQNFPIAQLHSSVVNRSDGILHLLGCWKANFSQNMHETSDHLQHECFIPHAVLFLLFYEAEWGNEKNGGSISHKLLWCAFPLIFIHLSLPSLLCSNNLSSSALSQSLNVTFVSTFFTDVSSSCP